MITTQFKYSLESGSKKFKCPDCNQKTLVRYIDNETKEYLPEEVGRCDRENNCGYHLTPKQYKNDKGTSLGIDTANFIEKVMECPKPINYLSLALLERSMTGYYESHFSKYIIDLFGKDKGSKLLLKYFVGRSRRYEGKANIFWRIDIDQKVCTGKIMLYDPISGKRRKDIFPTWVHAAKDKSNNSLFPDFNYHLCFFGEHLLGEFPEKPIAICESEKTAIIASFYIPQFNWLATGGASGCKWREYNVFKVLENKKIILFPDFGIYNKKTSKTCYQEWQERAEIIKERMKCEISVSAVLENSIPESERVNDFDLVNMLVKRDPNTGIALTDDNYPLIWDF